MNIRDITEALGYAESENFLRPERDMARVAPESAWTLRRAKEGCNLHGTYALRAPDGSPTMATPVVYVCESSAAKNPQSIHRSVWNQNAVPFLIVVDPNAATLFSGFRYADCGGHRRAQPCACGELSRVDKIADISRKWGGLHARSIDDGSVWAEWGKEVTPNTRVDWRLLDNISELDRQLQKRGLPSPVSHALIGKFVYLHYLRHRDILSDRKLERWGVAWRSVFGRDTRPNARLDAFWHLMAQMDDWLNGELFPLSPQQRRLVAPEALSLMAGAFSGDHPATGQLHLDFTPYDFSFIPVETLSVVYERFLHSTGNGEGCSTGEDAGAYYTPLPAVNLILDEVDHSRPLKRGMKVLDPSCGSGAFLVQCYRHLIEQERGRQGRWPPRPAELRSLLEEHIHGLDCDDDACRVAEFSLILTLLDYVSPPDLETYPSFRLPVLRGKNIVRGDFFDPEVNKHDILRSRSYDWIVGNPPWKALSASRPRPQDRHARDWMRTHATECPVGGHQIAEAFAWKIVTHLSSDGVVGLLLPAMTLFKDESIRFRETFFSRLDVWAIANFANLAYVLFGGRAEVAAAAVFYRPRQRRRTQGGMCGAKSRENAYPAISVYSPFLVNQLANRQGPARKRRPVWTLPVNAGEVSTVDVSDAETGNMLPWKLAMWGSVLDRRLLKKLGTFRTLDSLARQAGLKISEGLHLSKDDSLPRVTDLPGKQTIDFVKLGRGCGALVEFPRNSIKQLQPDEVHARNVEKALQVSNPPHIVVDASRRFAVFSMDFLAIPSRQIGIAGDPSSIPLLKALSLYMVSGLARYHQFMTSPEAGIHTTRATLKALRSLPVPHDLFDPACVRSWAATHDKIVAAPPQRTRQHLYGDDPPARRCISSENLGRINEMVSQSFNLSNLETVVIQDFISTRFLLNKGKASGSPASQPSDSEMRRYMDYLKGELDAYVGDTGGDEHCVRALKKSTMAVVLVEMVSKLRAHEHRHGAVEKSDPQLEAALDAILRDFSQWPYFDRSLRVHFDAYVVLGKPMQRVHWLRSQAALDANEIIVETLSAWESACR